MNKQELVAAVADPRASARPEAARAVEAVFDVDLAR